MKKEAEKRKVLFFDKLAQIGKAVCSSKRVELLFLLLGGPKTVEVLANKAGLTIANTSQHLQVLKAAKLVNSSKKGLYVTYEPASPEVEVFLHRMRLVGERSLIEAEEIFHYFTENSGDIEIMDPEELLKRLKRQDTVVLDVRPTKEYAAAHLPGSINIPMEQLDIKLTDIPKEKAIVVYCRGPYCLLSREAVEYLREKGYKAVRLEYGFYEWENKGYPLEETLLNEG